MELSRIQYLSLHVVKVYNKKVNGFVWRYILVGSHCFGGLHSHARLQSEMHLPMLRNPVKSGHGCSSKIYFDNAGVNVKLTVYNVTLTS